MSVEENIKTVRTWVEGGWNNGNLGLVDEMYLPDYVIHDPSAPDFPGGSEAFKGFVSMFRTAMPDFHMVVEDAIGQGDKVAWRFTVTGTQQGELFGIPPTGKPASVSGQVYSRFENGKWAEDYVNWDTLGMLQQLGVIPVPGAEPAGVGH